MIHLKLFRAWWWLKPHAEGTGRRTSVSMTSSRTQGQLGLHRETLWKEGRKEGREGDFKSLTSFLALTHGKA